MGKDTPEQIRLAQTFETERKKERKKEGKKERNCYKLCYNQYFSNYNVHLFLFSSLIIYDN